VPDPPAPNRRRRAVPPRAGRFERRKGLSR
jgi:hypothetical protein